MDSPALVETYFHIMPHPALHTTPSPKPDSVNLKTVNPWPYTLVAAILNRIPWAWTLTPKTQTTKP